MVRGRADDAPGLQCALLVYNKAGHNAGRSAQVLAMAWALPGLFLPLAESAPVIGPVEVGRGLRIVQARSGKACGPTGATRAEADARMSARVMPSSLTTMATLMYP